MAKTLMLFCVEPERAVQISEGIAAQLTAQNQRVLHFKPCCPSCGSVDEQKALTFITEGKYERLLDRIIDAHAVMARKADVIICTSTSFRAEYAQFSSRLNLDLAHNLDAAVIVATCPEGMSDEMLTDKAELASKLYAAEGLNIFAVASHFSPKAQEAVKALGLRPINVADISIHAQDIVSSSTRLTPIKYLSRLRAMAKSNKKTIVLPEGDVDRILLAVSSLREDDVVDVILLGDESVIREKAKALQCVIDESIAIISPSKDPRFEDYAQTLCELRKAKGMTIEKARELMADKTYFATMMVYKGDAAGMVAGATTTTAATITPALQFIKTKPGISTVSGAFLMCLPDRVYLYADCAVMPNPTPDQLKAIAISSAETAAAFGLDPKVAMLSYSTGASGKGPDVEATIEATRLVREAAPGLAVEGPIQYDAAVDVGVAKTKLPESTVAGHANVFVFPTLNAGNIACKAVQRASGGTAIGPILQGLNKPINDLSRGANVRDIINTVIVTAIQAQ